MKGEQDEEQLPFGNSFPLGRITKAIFENEIGFPPNYMPSKPRDYDIFILFNALSPELGCKVCP